ncbi:hypothetical protein GH714_023147 [Hevea brasiliensis]|uniref:Uncharacterized protein n=1 Tax=Hevea brasiliensis TaxID=3981 RepID=A0A6A6LBD3_HEVBR|nr:hypothetical protein GH714_023147 [Hevea brasiliensis]
MNKKSSCCAICENSNRASICTVCVNYRLNEYNSLLKSLKSRRDLCIKKGRKDGSNGQYDQICNARLPRGLDPHSVPSEELAASLGVLALEYGNEILIGMPVLLLVDVPSEVSTFEAFAKLLATLSSSKEVRSVFSLKMACSRSCKQVQKLNKSVWNVNSTISSSTLLESAHALHLTKNIIDHNLPNSATSFLYATEISDTGKNEGLIDGWDLVEHPTFPPPPSQTEDIEHWTRAMFIDATKK